MDLLNLDTLPVELVKNIADLLDNDDLKSLHSTSRKLHVQTYLTFARRFFDDTTVALNERGFQRLASLSEHHILSTGPRTLTVYSGRESHQVLMRAGLDECRREDLTSATSREAKSLRRDTRRAFRRRLHDLDKIQKNSADVETIANAMESLKSLKKVCIVNRMPHPNKQYPDAVLQKEFQHLCIATFRAMLTSGERIKAVRIDFTHDLLLLRRQMDDLLGRMKRLGQSLVQGLGNVATLTLRFDPDIPWWHMILPGPSFTRFSEFMAYFNNVTELELSGNLSHENGLTLPSLRSLSFRDVSDRTDTVTRMLQAGSETLENLSLVRLKLHIKSGFGPLLDLPYTVNNLPKLESLRLGAVMMRFKTDPTPFRPTWYVLAMKAEHESVMLAMQMSRSRSMTDWPEECTERLYRECNVERVFSRRHPTHGKGSWGWLMEGLSCFRYKIHHAS